MFLNRIPTFLGSLLLLVSTVSQALPDDWQQEMTIVSDRAEIDRKTGIVVYEGNVILTQGTLKIEASRLTLIRNDDKLEKAVAEGQPARYQQQMAADKPLTRAQGKRIDYFATQREVRVKGSARLEQEGNLFTGDLLTYDMTAETVSASGGQPATSSSEASSGDGETSPGRIRMVIQPQSSSDDAEKAGEAQ